MRVGIAVRVPSCKCLTQLMTPIHGTYNGDDSKDKFEFKLKFEYALQ